MLVESETSRLADAGTLKPCVSDPEVHSQDRDDLERRLKVMDLTQAASWILCEVAREALAISVDGKE